MLLFGPGYSTVNILAKDCPRPADGLGELENPSRCHALKRDVRRRAKRGRPGGAQNVLFVKKTLKEVWALNAYETKIISVLLLVFYICVIVSIVLLRL